MGKPFTRELDDLPDSLSFAENIPLEGLHAAVGRVQGGRCLVCGAGGSFSVATFTKLLFETNGIRVETITPLQFLQTEELIQIADLILFTARGRNKDILRVLDHAVRHRVRITLICASENSPAANRLRRQGSHTIFEFSYPALRDGFLAVNSLAVTWWTMARAFGSPLPKARLIKSSLSNLHSLSFVPADRRHTFLILFDRWTCPVAIDLESKLSEAGLSASLLSDWRQFGHGRHNWLAKNATFSSVVSLELGPESALAKKTLSLLPTSVPQTRISSELPGITGVCHLLLQSFAFVAELGSRVGIDPGRPGVPKFGSTIYHLGPMTPRPTRTISKCWNMEAAVERKLSVLGCGIEANLKNLVASAAKAFSSKLKRRRYGAIILDFDGTLAPSGLMPDKKLPREISTTVLRLLRSGVLIGIATGRGDSCHDNLRLTFPKKYWQQILVCHYNGATIGNLRELSEKPIEWSENPELRRIADRMADDPILSQTALLTFKKAQITIRADTVENAALVEKYIREKLRRAPNHSVRLVASSHTLDIVPVSSVKTALADHFREKLANSYDVLAIGDRGDLQGNDFELLTLPYSLSVDRVSTDLNSCWNYLPPDVYNHEGTALYLSQPVVGEGYFKIGIK